MQRAARYLFLVAGIVPALAHAQTNQVGHSDPIASVIVWVTLILFCAIVGRYLARQLNQPGVLGELIIGIILGNLCYYFGLQLVTVLREGTAIYDISQQLLAGFTLSQAVDSAIPNALYAKEVLAALSGSHGTDLLKISYVLDVFSRYGIIFLLFMVGLESSVHELRHTGKESMKVAIIGVIAPMIFGFAAAHLLLPEVSFKVALFVAATLSATSIGITAGVLKEMKKLRTREAKTILGAAVIDDVLGLIILAIVSSIVVSGAVEPMMIVHIVFSAIAFFVAVLLIGPWVLRQAVNFFRYLALWEIKLFISLFFVMALAWLATIVNLATIIGAFAAGLIIHDSIFEKNHPDNDDELRLSVKHLIAPLESILAPLFFILIGIQVKLETFFDWQVLLTAIGLIVAAIVGKLLSGLGGHSKDDRWLIGIGMMPRGEVGLVFAAVGRTLGIMTDQLFSAIILMIIVTTLVTPPLLKMRYNKNRSGVKI